jgi:ACS family D-galactonate transporter-like MFS transporter
MSVPAIVPSLEKKTNVRWNMFALLLLLVTINYVDRAALSVAMPLISKEFNMAPAMQGLLLSCFFWTYGLMQIPGGMLSDRFKPRIVIAAATIFWGAFQGLAGLCTNVIALIFTRLGLGAAEGPIFPAGAKLNGMWMTPNERGRGATLFDSGAPLGAAMGALLITWLITALGSWRMAFVISGVGTVLAGAWAWYYIRNSPRDHKGVNEAEAKHVEAAQTKELAEEPPNLTGRSMDFFKYRSVWCLCLGWMSFTTVWYGLLTWLPTYLNKVHGFNIWKMGGATFIAFLCGFFGELTGGWISDKWRAAGARPNRVMRSLFGAAAIIAAISIFIVANTHNAVVVVVLLSCTLFFLRWCGLFFSIPPNIATKSKVGFVTGTMNLCGTLMGICVPIIVGLIVQYTGSYFPAMMFFVAGAIGLLIFTSLIDYEKKIPV